MVVSDFWTINSTQESKIWTFANKPRSSYKSQHSVDLRASMVGPVLWPDSWRSEDAWFWVPAYSSHPKIETQETHISFIGTSAIICADCILNTLNRILVANFYINYQMENVKNIKKTTPGVQPRRSSWSDLISDDVTGRTYGMEVMWASHLKQKLPNFAKHVTHIDMASDWYVYFLLYFLVLFWHIHNKPTKWNKTFLVGKHLEYST